jgi:hypothetical protein
MELTTAVYFLCKAGTAGTDALIQEFMDRLVESGWVLIANNGAEVRTYYLGTRQLVFTELCDTETGATYGRYVNSASKCPLSFASLEEQVSLKGGLLTQQLGVTVTSLKQVGTANAITIVSSDNGVTFQASCSPDMHAVLSDYAMMMPEASGHFSFLELLKAIKHTEKSNLDTGAKS